MTERVAVDSNVVIDWLRDEHGESRLRESTQTILLPLPVVGELFTGAYSSRQKSANVDAVERTIARWSILIPDVETARVYGRIRAALRTPSSVSVARMNDLWIAALCVQNDVPLITDDRGFDAIPGLVVIR